MDMVIDKIELSATWKSDAASSQKQGEEKPQDISQISATLNSQQYVINPKEEKESSVLRHHTHSQIISNSDAISEQQRSHRSNRPRLVSDRGDADILPLEDNVCGSQAGAPIQTQPSHKELPDHPRRNAPFSKGRRKGSAFDLHKSQMLPEKPKKQKGFTLEHGINSSQAQYS